MTLSFLLSEVRSEQTPAMLVDTFDTLVKGFFKPNCPNSPIFLNHL
jgi:hypothetical protein